MGKKKTGPQLLVEGPDDLHSLVHILQKSGISKEDSRYPHVEDCGGYTKVLGGMRAFFDASPEVAPVGIVIDADDSVEDRWKSVASRLSGFGYSLPGKIPVHGWVSGNDGPKKCGVWIMPDNVNTGYLEHFLTDIAQPKDRLWHFAEYATRCALYRNAKLPCKDEPKGMLRTWLSWQDPPGNPYGTAVKAGCFDVQSTRAIKFVSWYKRLFD